ncbi:MAG TPA: NAD(P)H-dependent oxidoreductase [Candidatus Acidoferrum sp.]|nr:NAD(P)H-dependent oxidoreductase [Candidatus Acidoferrum sp.]
MSTLIRFDSSPMGESSISRKLTTKFVETWRKTHSGGKVIERDLTTLGLKPIDVIWLAAIQTPEAALTKEQKEAIALSDSLIAELQQADEYVFGVPMHNFSIPSTLKLWIDQIVRGGKTFAYGGADGPKGLLTGKKATVLIASGGVYGQESALAAFNFVAPYLRTMFGFLGVTDVTIISAEGTAQLRSGKVDVQEFLAPTLEKVHTHASH